VFFNLLRKLPQMFALLMDPYAIIQVSIFLQFQSVVAVPLAVTRGTPVEKYCCNQSIAALLTVKA